MTLRIGLSTYDISATELVQLAVAADEAGFESLWLGEHIVLPYDYASEHPTTGDTAHQHHTGPIVDPSTKLLDPLVALAACAAATTRLRLATGIYILPLRHPLLTARMTLTLQDVAGGRFLLGVGSGWLEEEFDSLGVPFDDRAARMDETLAILREAWSGKVFSHDGPLFSFGNVQLSPEPVSAADPRRQHRTGAAPGRHRRRRLVQLGDTLVRGRRPAPRPGGRATRGRRQSAASSRSTSASPDPIKPSWPATKPRASSTCSSGPTSSGPGRVIRDDKRTAFAAAAAELGVDQQGVAHAR